MTYYLTLLLCAQGSAPSSKFRQAGLMVGTDKVTTHAYETMYGIFLKQLSRRGAKLFEIGLGCNMGYGPGASMKLWANLLPHAEVHFAEYDGACVDKWVRRHSIRNTVSQRLWLPSYEVLLSSLKSIASCAFVV